LIMTTNAGAAEMEKGAIGFGRETREGEDTEAINKLFSPEFRNRLDAIIGFGHLTPEIVLQVVDKFVIQLENQLADKRLSIELDRAARDWLAKTGYDKAYGARPLGRTIQEHIKKPLAKALLFEDVSRGGVVEVTLKDDKSGLNVTVLRDSGGDEEERDEEKSPELVD